MTSLAPLQDSPASAIPAKIRVMVVDDSAVVRGLVSRWVDEDSGMETVGRFANGQLALGGIAGCTPDVVVLDIEMPVMDGMTALPELLKLRPGVKIIMSSTLTRKNAEISMKALALGATDYIPKPESNRGVTTSVDFRTALLGKIKALVPQKAARAPIAPIAARAPGQPVEPRAAASAPPARDTPALRSFSPVKPRILAIGSSTGGPQALARVIEDVASATAGIPVVITQHMPPTFTAILAEHLARSAGRAAREGSDGEKIEPGTIYVAPGGFHMSLIEKNGAPALSIADGPMINFCKPAVDPLFESVAELYGSAVLALVLTGMGHDGAKGAVRIADAGGAVIAQDEATSVVWGMPGAAIEAGACAAVLPLDEIGRKTSNVLQGILS